MTQNKKEGCVAPAAGPLALEKEQGKPETVESDEEKKMSVMVGKEAPDFDAAAYFEGGFQNFKLSDFRGKWVFLCFYPGDFTFV
jgi:hypothetical protein